MPKIIICKECGGTKHHEARGLCHRCYNRQHYRQSPEEAKKRARQYYWRNRERVLAYRRRYDSEHRGACMVCGVAISKYAMRCPSCSTQAQWDDPKEGLRKAVRRNYGPCKRCGQRKAEARGFCLQCYNHLRHRAGGRYGLTLVERNCFYCSEEAEEWDHFVPVSAGGYASQGNMVPACKKCNMTKLARLPENYIEQLVLA